MWCKVCRQDVPALPSPERRCFCCPRCGSEVVARDTVATEPRTSEDDDFKAGMDEPTGYDGWELDEQLRHIDRVLRTARSAPPVASPTQPMLRFDAAHAAQSDWHSPRMRRKLPAGPTTRRTGVGVGTVLCFGLGMISFLGGCVFLGWSLVTGRHEPWAIGLPLALGGPIALLVGLALQIHRLWGDYCGATTKLDEVDRELHELQATTTMLGTTQGPLSSVFYAHLTNGAGPQVLLTDLKSQLDLLAMKLAQEKA